MGMASAGGRGPSRSSRGSPATSSSTRVTTWNGTSSTRRRKTRTCSPSSPLPAGRSRASQSRPSGSTSGASRAAPSTVSRTSPASRGSCRASGIRAQAKLPVTRCVPAPSRTAGVPSRSTTATAAPSAAAPWGQWRAEPGRVTQASAKVSTTCSKVPPAEPRSSVRPEGHTQRRVSAPWTRGQSRSSCPWRTHGTQSFRGAGTASGASGAPSAPDPPATSNSATAQRCHVPTRLMPASSRAATAARFFVNRRDAEAQRMIRMCVLCASAPLR